MITIYFDGLCYPRNPGGVAAYGYLIYRGNELMHNGCGIVGEGMGMTNNVAEYEGLKAALWWLNERGIRDKIEIRGDSQLVIKQLKGEWQIRSETSRKYAPKIQRLLEGKEVSFVWIRRDENEAADRLSRKAYESYKKRI
ncbi:MAG: ribonuclease HI family protein [Methanotrichaceae archaeon]|nr:ribonuclease HI family protein [Methanotrichaceae archaeon]